MTKAAWMWVLCALRAKPNTHYNPFYIKTSDVGGMQANMLSAGGHTVIETDNSLFESDCSLRWLDIDKIKPKSCVMGSVK